MTSFEAICGFNIRDLQPLPHLLPGEESVTAVSASTVCGTTSNASIGEEIQITVNNKGYNGRVAVKGTHMLTYIIYYYKQLF